MLETILRGQVCKVCAIVLVCKVCNMCVTVWIVFCSVWIVFWTRCTGGGVISARPGLQAHAAMSRVHVHNWTGGGVIQMSVILDTYRHGVHVQNFCGYGLIS